MSLKRDAWVDHPPYGVRHESEHGGPTEGGVGGYEDFQAILADPNHEEHADMLAWVGGSFDPSAFDIEATNRILKTIKP